MGLLPPNLIGSPSLRRLGYPGAYTPDKPAAGANFTSTPSGLYFERLLSVRVKLVADANAANRTVTLEFCDPGGTVYRTCGAAATSPASETWDWEFSVWQDVAEFPVGAKILSPLDPLIIPQGWSWKLTCVNIQATDQLSRIRVVSEKFTTDSNVPGHE